MPAPQEAQVAKPVRSVGPFTTRGGVTLGLLRASRAWTFSSSSSGMIGGILISTMLAGSCKPPVREFRRP